MAPKGDMQGKPPKIVERGTRQKLSDISISDMSGWRGHDDERQAQLLLCCLFVVLWMQSLSEWLKVIGPELSKDPRGLALWPIRPQHPPRSPTRPILHRPEVRPGC